MYKHSSALRIICKCPFLSQDFSFSDILLLVYKNKYVFNISWFFPLKKSTISSLGAMWNYELSPLQPEVLRGVASYSQGCQAGSILHSLSWLLAAATRVLTRLSAPSNVARSEKVKGEPMRRYNIHFIVYLQNCIR